MFVVWFGQQCHIFASIHISTITFILVPFHLIPLIPLISLRIDRIIPLITFQPTISQFLLPMLHSLILFSR